MMMLMMMHNDMETVMTHSPCMAAQ